MIIYKNSQLNHRCFFFFSNKQYDQLCWGLSTGQPLWVILCHLPEKGRKEIEELVEKMKEKNGKNEEQE